MKIKKSSFLLIRIFPSVWVLFLTAGPLMAQAPTTGESSLHVTPDIVGTVRIMRAPREARRGIIIGDATLEVKGKDGQTIYSRAVLPRERVIVSNNGEYIGVIDDRHSMNGESKFTLVDSAGRKVWEKDGIDNRKVLLSSKGNIIGLSGQSPERKPPVEHLRFYDAKGDLVKEVDFRNGQVSMTDDGSLVFALKEGGLSCFDHLGNLSWKKNFKGLRSILASPRNQLAGIRTEGSKRYLTVISANGEVVAKRALRGGKLLSFSDKGKYLILWQRGTRKALVYDVDLNDFTNSLQFDKNELLFSAAFSEGHDIRLFIKGTPAPNTRYSLVAADAHSNIVFEEDVTKDIRYGHSARLSVAGDNVLLHERVTQNTFMWTLEPAHAQD